MKELRNTLNSINRPLDLPNELMADFETYKFAIKEGRISNKKQHANNIKEYEKLQKNFRNMEIPLHVAMEKIEKIEKQQKQIPNWMANKLQEITKGFEQEPSPYDRMRLRYELRSLETYEAKHPTPDGYGATNKIISGIRSREDYKRERIKIYPKPNGTYNETSKEIIDSIVNGVSSDLERIENESKAILPGRWDKNPSDEPTRKMVSDLLKDMDRLELCLHESGIINKLSSSKVGDVNTNTGRSFDSNYRDRINARFGASGGIAERIAGARSVVEAKLKECSEYQQNYDQGMEQKWEHAKKSFVKAQKPQQWQKTVPTEKKTGGSSPKSAVNFYSPKSSSSQTLPSCSKLGT